MTRIPSVSVVVPVHNGSRSLPGLLEALDRQTAAPELFEVLVVDDCSTDDTAAVVEASTATLVRAPARRGSYVARNLGAAAARGGALAFTDADCVPADDWIERGIAAIGAEGADLVAGRVDVPLGENPTTAALLDFTRYLDQERHVREHGFGATANLWLRRDVLDTLGGFNERLTTGGDLEVGNRALARGFELRYDADVVVTHQPRSRVGQLARKGFRLGFGTAQHRRHAEGPSRDRPRLHARPGAYVPHTRRSLDGLERLERSGYRPSARRRLAMHALHYFYLQLPIVAGSIAGSIAEARASRRTSSPDPRPSGVAES
jgi:glycosyltransferase involved in cell wall biosynthesis